MERPKRTPPRKLNELTPEQRRKHTAANARVIHQREQRKQAERGKLADFKLFKLIATVAWFSRAQPKAPRATGNEQIDAEAQLDWALLGQTKPILARELIKAVVTLDVSTLERAAATVEHLRQYRPRSGEQFAPLNRERVTLLDYFARHQSGNIEQLRGWMSKRMGWDVSDERSRKKYDKRIHRACDDLALPIADSTPGPKRGSKQALRNR